jgi:hypothetical protein
MDAKKTITACPMAAASRQTLLVTEGTPWLCELQSQATYGV